MKKTNLTLLILMISLFSFGQQTYNHIEEFGNYRKNWALVEKEGLLGFINSDGTEIVKPQYNNILLFGDYRKDWALVEKDGLFGFISSDGSEIIKPQYKSVKDENFMKKIQESKK